MLERAAALKHDLGKYVAWQSANFEDDAWEGPLDDTFVEALRADILRTRSRSEGDESAWEVWAAHTEELPRPLTEPELVVVEDAVQVLRSHEAALRAEDRAGLAEARSEIRQAQQDIRRALRDFHRRLLRGA
ncbi:MAG: hypothetical protein AAF799_38075 [Myxococcota bacterium]